MTTVMSSPATMSALGQAAFISIAIHVIQKNRSRTLTKARGREGSAAWVTQLATDHPDGKHRTEAI